MCHVTIYYSINRMHPLSDLEVVSVDPAYREALADEYLEDPQTMNFEGKSRFYG